MSTTFAKKETVERKWYVIDAAGKPLGRVAVQAATLLRGKHKPTFTPNVDCGDFVIIVNAAKAELTGKKLEKKLYQHHTGWIGNLKEVKYATLMAEKPEFAMELAVKDAPQEFHRQILHDPSEGLRRRRAQECRSEA